MKNNNWIIVAAVGIAVLIGGLFYLGGRNRPPSQPLAAVDSHGHGLGTNVSLAFLNGLVGKPVPAFSLGDASGTTYSTESLRGKNTILFFSEGLMCYPACWNQMVAFAKDSRFQSGGTQTLTIVLDSKEDWQKAINKMPDLAKAAVVFDAGGSVSREFGVLSTPSSMHPGSLPGHTYVLLDKDGVVRYVLDDPSMSVRNDELWTEVAKLSAGG